MKTVITGLMALVWSLGLHAQVADTAAVAPEVMPIESPELHGAREATEEEKAMARELARDQRNQQQTRFLRYDANGFTQLDSLTVKIHEPAETPVEDYYMPEYPLYALSHGFAPWELHKGLNVNLGASVSAGFGSGAVGGAAFTQDVNLMYVTQLSPKASLAVGRQQLYCCRTDGYAELSLQRALERIRLCAESFHIGQHKPVARCISLRPLRGLLWHGSMGTARWLLGFGLANDGPLRCRSALRLQQPQLHSDTGRG